MNKANTVNAKIFSPFGMSLYRISLKLNKVRATKQMSTDEDYEEVKSLESVEQNLWRTKLWLSVFQRNHLDLAEVGGRFLSVL